MKKETMLRAVNDIRDEFIEEAAPKGTLPKEKPVFSWLNIRVLAGAFAVLLLALFIPGLYKQPDSPQNPNVLIPKPFTVCETMQEAESIAGFALDAPESYNGWKMAEISVYNSQMIDIAYTDADGNPLMHIRKGGGSKDISGDFNTYEYEKTEETGGRTVTYKGSGDLCSLILWTEDGYSYSVSLQTGIPMEDAQQLTEMIR